MSIFGRQKTFLAEIFKKFLPKTSKGIQQEVDYIQAIFLLKINDYHKQNMVQKIPEDQLTEWMNDIYRLKDISSVVSLVNWHLNEQIVEMFRCIESQDSVPLSESVGKFCDYFHFPDLIISLPVFSSKPLVEPRL